MKGHPVLWMCSCSSRPLIGQSRACSYLSALNMGGHRSLSIMQSLSVWRWQLLSPTPVSLFEIVLFCFLFLFHTHLVSGLETAHGIRPLESAVLVQRDQLNEKHSYKISVTVQSHTPSLYFVPTGECRLLLFVICFSDLLAEGFHPLLFSMKMQFAIKFL